MRVLRDKRRPIAAIAIASLLAVAIPAPAAKAALVTTERAAAAATAATDPQRAKVTAFLSRADVRAEMERLGVSPEEAEARVAALSDDEVANISGKLDELPAGQGVFGTLLGAAVVVFLVLLITDILGFTHVFSFTNKGSARAN